MAGGERGLGLNVMNVASDALMIIEKAGNGEYVLIQANTSSLEVLCLIDNSVIPTPFDRFFTKDHYEPVKRAIDEAASTGHSEIGVAKIGNLDKETHLCMRIDRFESEPPCRLLIAARDITKKRQIMKELKASEARFRHIFEQAPIGIFLQDKDRRMIDCNEALVEMTDTDRDDLLSKSYKELVHPEDSEKDARLFELLFSGRIDHYNLEKRIVSRDGRALYCNLNVTSIKDDSGKPQYALGMISDITQRKRMEVEVLRTRDYYQSILDNMPTLMWRSNAQLMREFFNKAWLGFTGRTFNEEYGHGWMRGIHPDDLERLMEAQERSFLTQENFEIEYRLLAFDNEYHWMIDMGRPFYDSHGEFKGYIGSCQDNTRSRKMQERLQAKVQKHI